MDTKSNLLNMETIRKYINNGQEYFTRHCLNRIQQRNISIKDVKNCIQNEEIIEYYDNDYPYESCLIFGYSENNKVMHVVCGINSEKLFIVTAYYPGDIEWENDYKTRRKK